MRSKITLLATTIPAFMSPFDGGVVNLALPTIGHALGAQLSYLVWIPTSYLVASAVFQAPIGTLGDMRGRKSVFSFGILAFTLGSLFAGFSPNIQILILTRLIQGIGSASMTTSSLAIVVDTFRADRGMAVGINTSAVYSGLTVGPVAGAFILEYLGWRSIFFVNIPIGIISLLLVLLYVPSDTKEKETIVPRKRFDVPGSFLFGLFLVSLMLFLSSGEIALTRIEIVLFGILTIVSIVSFVIVESKFSDNPIIDLELFTHNRLFTAGNLTSIFNYTTNQGTILVMSLYLQYVIGYTPTSAALILFAQPVAQAVTSSFAGMLSDRIDARILSSIGIGFRALGLFGLSLLSLNHSAAASSWIPLAIVGFGHGLFSPPNTNSVMSSVSPKKRGIASGIMGTIRVSCNSAGIVVMTDNRGLDACGSFCGGKRGNWLNFGNTCPLFC